MQNLKSLLKNKFTNAKRVVVLGVGSDLRGDDIAGILVAQKIEAFQKKIGERKRLKVLLGFTAPENFTGDIKRFAPTHLIVVDSAEIKKAPGDVVLLDPQTVGGMTFSTHSLPLKIMTDYLLIDLKCEILIIGIQPKTLHYGSPVSGEVKKSAEAVARIINATLKSSLKFGKKS